MAGTSIRLGKIAGIEIGINYSLLLIAALVTYQLASYVLPTRAPGFDDTAYVYGGVLGAMLFFASILWHEMAHALMAKFYRIGVRRIVLFFLGGIAEIEDEPRKAYQEFWIAIVGPLSSLLLGGIFLGLSAFAAAGSVLEQVLFWLGVINVMLAIFNMIPGFPLDGGRVLRAILWWISGSYLKATRWASYMGQSVAYLMITLGILSIFVPSSYIGSGIWLLLIGFFLLNAAKGHLHSAQVRSGLQGVPVGQLVRNHRTLQSHWPLSYAIDMMALGQATTAAPVLRDGEWVGVLSVENFNILPRLHWGNVQVESVMTPIHGVRQVDAYQDLYDMLHDEDLSGQPYLLVTMNQRPIGLLSQREIVGYAERMLRGN